jgi:hypothetical protein
MQEFNILQLNQYQATREINSAEETNKNRDLRCNTGQPKIKVPAKFGQILVLIAFFCFVNRLAVNFVAAEPLARSSRQAMPLISKISPTTQPISLTQSAGGEKISLRLPGGVLTADGVYAIGIIGVAAAVLYVAELMTRLACLVVRRLNNSNGDQHEFEMAAKLV